jgi:hypothetical protein
MGRFVRCHPVAVTSRTYWSLAYNLITFSGKTRTNGLAQRIACLTATQKSNPDIHPTPPPIHSVFATLKTRYTDNRSSFPCEDFRNFHHRDSVYSTGKARFAPCSTKLVIHLHLGRDIECVELYLHVPPTNSACSLVLCLPPSWLTYCYKRLFHVLIS